MTSKLLFIIGDSGVGKDTVARYLKERYGMGVVVSHTTRPMREGEQQGREHIFIHMRPDTNIWDMCACHGCTVFAHTVYGGNIYFTTLENIMQTIRESPCKAAVYIIDELGLSQVNMQMLAYEGIEHKTLRLVRSEDLRLQSGITGERMERDKTRQHLDEHCFDYTVCNNGTLSDLHQQLDTLVQSITHSDVSDVSMFNK